MYTVASAGKIKTASTFGRVTGRSNIKPRRINNKPPTYKKRMVYAATPPADTKECPNCHNANRQKPAERDKVTVLRRKRYESNANHAAVRKASAPKTPIAK